MTLIALKKTTGFLRPYPDEMFLLYKQIRHLTVFVKGTYYTGGLLIGASTVITSPLQKEKYVKIRLPDGHVCSATRKTHNEDYALSYYELDYVVSDYRKHDKSKLPFNKKTVLLGCCNSFAVNYLGVAVEDSLAAKSIDESDNNINFDRIDKTCSLPIVDLEETSLDLL